MADMPADAAMANASSNARSRAYSTSSDRPSTTGIYNPMSPPLSVSPDAAFIAASAASQIVTNSHDTHSETWYDRVGIIPSGEVSLVSDGALRLANNFVDHLLFNILAAAGCTTLPSLRSAVIDVLKPKLARDVINSADEELKEYLGGSGVENLARSVPLEKPKDWDLELIWKRTRLRCMVYSSLGDMEEEEEDFHMEQEQLNGGGNALAGLVSPPVAIFLTSILECMGEQVLILAGQAAFSRLRANYERQLKDGTQLAGTISDRIVVEELDMERVALDRTLGRLWRTWKKKIRSPTEPSSSRPFSRGSANGSGASSHKYEGVSAELPAALSPRELDTTESQIGLSHDTKDGVQGLKAEGDCLDPSMLPLPDSDIEATYSDEEEDKCDSVPSRPKSWAADFSFPTQALVKRTPSLPSRKKPRFSSMSTNGHSEIRGGKSVPERAKNTLPSSLPEVEAETEMQMQTGANTSRLVDGATPGAAAIGGIAKPNPSSVTTDFTTGIDIEEDELDDIKGHETDGEIEGFAEEPEILTSSRISVGGRSSPATSESGRPTSVVLTRSNSVGSVRVIEVSGPRARASSIESNQRSPTIRSLGSSRETSTSRTPPIVEENDTSIPHVTVTKTRPDTISSFTEDPYNTGTTLAPPPRKRSPTLTSPPMASRTSAPIKVAVIANTTQEERHENFQRPTSLRSPPLPTLPERSPSRPVYVQSTSIHRIAPESPNFPRSFQGDLPSPARFKPRRTSEESSFTRPADVARNFEELIQSNETLQYTLTPENMRDMDVSEPLRVFGSNLTVRQSQSSQPNGSPKIGHRTGKSDDAITGDNSRPSSIKRSISISRSAGLGSYADIAVNGKYTAGNLKGLQSSSSKTRTGPPPQARDARVSRESMQDFANFIRSTGPPGDSNSHANRPPTSSSSATRSTTRKSSIRKSSSIEVRRPKLQARDAVVNSSQESSELIDFIRQGPPGTSGNNTRIPRTIAPFRNTQDSDYMMSGMGGKAIDAIIPNVRTSLASTNVTETSAASSMNSQSALLNRSNRKQSYTGGGFDEDEMTPKRTQRRVRDPYAIDFSDEEDDEYDTLSKLPTKQEESLIDFLNNYSPPAELLTQSVVPPKKKSSSPNLIARLRSGPSVSRYGSGHSRKGSSASESRSINNRTGARTTHTPIVIPSMTDKFNPSVTPLDTPRTTPFGRVPMKKFEPRDAGVSNPKTAELADFLRGSQPPPHIAAISPSEDKASSGFSRIFERRKKSTAY